MANPSPQQRNASGHRNVAVPSCHLIFGFAPGASTAKQLMAFSGCRWDLFCSWALALTAPLAESKVAALASEWGQPLLQRAGSLEGFCAGWAQGCFDRAHMDTSCWLSEIGRATKIPLCVLVWWAQWSSASKGCVPVMFPLARGAAGPRNLS